MSSHVRHQTFFGTIVQSAPRLRELFANMRPTWHLPSLATLDPTFIADHGIGGLIWDVDGTLTEHHGALAVEAVAPFRRLLAQPRLRHALLSNADERRVRELGVLFPDIPVIRGYRHDGVTVYRRLLRGAETWSDGSGGVADSAIALRKPSADLVREAVRALGIDSSAVVMVGDQYLTDIAGANMAGVRSIKLPTIARTSFPVAVQVAQRLESIVHRLRHGRVADLASTS